MTFEFNENLSDYVLLNHKKQMSILNCPSFQATLYMGGHGERLIQCREIELKTLKAIPMQVDGEPCRLRPSTILIKARNQANMIAKPKRRGSVPIANE